MAACAAAVAVPWAFSPALRDGLALPKAAAAAAAAVAGAACWAASGAPSLAVGLEAPLAAFTAAALAAAACSIDRPSSLFGLDLDPVASLTGLAAALSGFYLGVSAARGRDDAGLRIDAALIAGAVPLALLCLVQVFAARPFLFLSPNVMGRAVGTFGHPVALGSYLALIVPVALALTLGAQRAPLRPAALAAAVLGAAALAASASRVGLVGAACGSAAVLWLDGRPAARRAVLGVAVAAAAAVLLAAGTERRGGSRPLALGAAWQAFRERPLLGWGPGTFGLSYRRLRTPALLAAEGPDIVFPHAHDDWAEVLSAMGAVGAAAYVWLHFGAIARSRGAAGVPGGAAAAGAAVALGVFSKLNLPALPVAFLGAMTAGAALGGRPARSGRAASAAAGMLFLGAAGWGAWSAGRRLPAERHALLGRLARGAGRPRDAAVQLEGAVASTPESLTFRLDLMNLLWDVASAAPAAERGLLLDRARDVALGGLAARPAEPEFMRLLGLAELRRARWAGADSLSASRAALEGARALDPLSPLLRANLAALKDPDGDRMVPGVE